MSWPYQLSWLSLIACKWCTVFYAISISFLTMPPTYDAPIQPLILIVNHTVHQTFDCQSHHSLDLPWSYTCPCIYGHCQSSPLIRFEIALHQPCIVIWGHPPIIYTFSHVTPSPHFKVQRFLPTRFSAWLFKCVMFCV